MSETVIRFLRNNVVTFAVVGSLALAAVSGFFASQALGLGDASGPPTTTTTVSVGAGEAGPPGPAGPEGPPGPSGSPGAESCPTGSTFEGVELNHPGGHVTIWTCVAS